MRPGEIATLDVRFNESQLRRIMLCGDFGAGWKPRDVAVDDDNDWADAAVVDAHAYIG